MGQEFGWEQKGEPVFALNYGARTSKIWGLVSSEGSFTQGLVFHAAGWEPQFFSIRSLSTWAGLGLSHSREAQIKGQTSQE